MTDVKRLGMIRAGGGCMFVSRGSPRRHVQWLLTGPGVLTPIQTFSDVEGVALAVWDGTGVAQAQDVTVQASEKT